MGREQPLYFGQFGIILSSSFWSRPIHTPNLNASLTYLHDQAKKALTVCCVSGLSWLMTCAGSRPVMVSSVFAAATILVAIWPCKVSASRACAMKMKILSGCDTTEECCLDKVISILLEQEIFFQDVETHWSIN